MISCTMPSPAQSLWHQAERLKHAVVRDRIIDAQGRIVEERDFHYLTCKRCDLERRAQALEDYYRDFVQA